MVVFFHIATLLERFAYASDDNTSGATYNFLSSEDWNGNEHDHKVTYGYEITKTTEFEGLQTGTMMSRHINCRKDWFMTI